MDMYFQTVDLIVLCVRGYLSEGFIVFDLFSSNLGRVKNRITTYQRILKVNSPKREDLLQASSTTELILLNSRPLTDLLKWRERKQIVFYPRGPTYLVRRRGSSCSRGGSAPRPSFPPHHCTVSKKKRRYDVRDLWSV